LASFYTEIPQWDAKDSQYNYRSKTWKFHPGNQRPFTEFNGVADFFDAFPFVPNEIVRSGAGAKFAEFTAKKSPYPEIQNFLDKIRSKGHNMFVAPVEDECIPFLQQETGNSYCSVRINIVWESATPTDGHMLVFAALGDVCFVEFLLTENKKDIKEYKFQYCSFPPEFPTASELWKNRVEKRNSDTAGTDGNSDKRSSSELQIKKFGKYSAAFTSCDFNEIIVVLSPGYIDFKWLNFWKLTKEVGISSVDVRDGWSMVLYNKPAWKGDNLVLTDESEPCFSQGVGWMNDHSQSLIVFKMIK